MAQWPSLATCFGTTRLKALIMSTPATQPAPVNPDGTITRLVKKLMQPYLVRIEQLEAEVAALKGKKR